MTPKACCRAIYSLMYPTAQGAKKDSVAVMLTKRLFDDIYKLAKKGSK